MWGQWDPAPRHRRETGGPDLPPPRRYRSTLVAGGTWCPRFLDPSSTRVTTLGHILGYGWGHPCCGAQGAEVGSLVSGVSLRGVRWRLVPEGVAIATPRKPRLRVRATYSQRAAEPGLEPGSGARPKPSGPSPGLLEPGAGHCRHAAASLPDTAGELPAPLGSSARPSWGHSSGPGFPAAGPRPAPHEERACWGGGGEETLPASWL